jgi:hypothetical protein
LILHPYLDDQRDESETINADGRSDVEVPNKKVSDFFFFLVFYS